MTDHTLRHELRPALVLLAAFTLLTGVVYPLAVTGAAAALFPREAGGSVVMRGGTAVGSALIGQDFQGPMWFHGRPSAAADGPYQPRLSAGSNLGPINPALLDSVRARAAALRAEGGATAELPVDLLTASGSGLDPHITPAAARWQEARVAAARGLLPATVHALVTAHIEARQFGLLGEPRVNVLQLNLALDSLRGTP
ncbi:MAG: potassium-transporting ATPase subunit KdpC [Gemmatimonadetes bacterium]|nr:potassium-transporting ATPase subunit KdpC [Gemmatimonadota bacterium]